MGLFTNRKREVDDDVVKASEAIDGLEPSWISDPPDPVDAIPEVAAPFADDPTPTPSARDAATDAYVSAEERAAGELARYGIDLAETEPSVPPGPRRASTDEAALVQAGNVEIDAVGLLDMLGVDPDASLSDISQARLRFLVEHDPAAESDPEAARLKERIRRQVNTAYASFRLTRAD